MAIYQHQLDLVFGALSDTTRRGILAQLSEGECNVSSLAKPYNISQPAVSKHLRVLERAGLIKRTKKGRENYIRVNADIARQARDWITYYTKFWTRQFDTVEEYLERNEAKYEHEN